LTFFLHQQNSHRITNINIIEVSISFFPRACLFSPLVESAFNISLPVIARSQNALEVKSLGEKIPEVGISCPSLKRSYSWDIPQFEYPTFQVRAVQVHSSKRIEPLGSPP
jgi:hypothetical protein